MYIFSQCCGSGMFIPDPGSWFLPIPDPGSRIPDPKTATKERGKKKLNVKPFYVATKFNKIVNYFSFEVLKKKIWANFQRILPKKLSKSSSKYGLGIRDPRSGIRKKPIPDPGSRGQKGTGSRIPDPRSGSATLYFPRTNYNTNHGFLVSFAPPQTTKIAGFKIATSENGP
jgi:hypothetical protein